MKRRSVPFLVALVTLALCSCSLSTGKREPLTDIKTITVIVDNSEESLARVGLEASTLRTNIELGLQQSRLAVVPPKRMTDQELLEAAANKDKGRPVSEAITPSLHLEVSLPYAEDGVPAPIAIALRLQQQVQLPPTNWEAFLMLLGANDFAFSATTWEADDVISLSGSVPKKTEGATKALVNRFLNDYFAKNPELIPQGRTVPYGLDSSDKDPKLSGGRQLSWDPSHAVYTSSKGAKYFKRLGETDTDVVVRVLIDSVAGN